MHQHRQIHVWITESDYLMLREQSTETQESVSAIIRRLIKAERNRVRTESPRAASRPTPRTDRTLEDLRAVVRQYASPQH